MKNKEGQEDEFPVKKSHRYNDGNDKVEDAQPFNLNVSIQER
jgi:hypothetical protein